MYCTVADAVLDHGDSKLVVIVCSVVDSSHAPNFSKTVSVKAQPVVCGLFLKTGKACSQLLHAGTIGGLTLLSVSCSCLFISVTD